SARWPVPRPPSVEWPGANPPNRSASPRSCVRQDQSACRASWPGCRFTRALKGRARAFPPSRGEWLNNGPRSWRGWELVPTARLFQTSNRSQHRWSRHPNHPVALKRAEVERPIPVLEEDNWDVRIQNRLGLEGVGSAAAGQLIG